MIIIGSLLFVKGQIPPLRDDERGKYKRLYENDIVWKKICVKVIED